jgi:uncharacterized membrane protein HdeD (DUF308 family)
MVGFKLAHDNGKQRPKGGLMSNQPVEQQWWFRAIVGLLTLLCGIGLFAAANLGIHNLVSALIAFLCLMGLERLFSGLLGMIMAFLRARRLKRA